MILRVRVISSTFVSNAANLQVIDFPHHFHLFFHLYRALATGFILEICFKLFGSNYTSLSCIKTPQNVNIYFNLYSFSTFSARYGMFLFHQPIQNHLMEMTSLGQKALKEHSTFLKWRFFLIFLNFDAFQASLSSCTSLRLLTREKSCFQVNWRIHKTRILRNLTHFIYVVDLSKTSTLFFHFVNIFFYNCSESWKLKSCNIYIVNIWHYVDKSPPPPSLNFDPGDFKGTGHKFNFCFIRCKFAGNRFSSSFSPLFSSLWGSSNGIYFRNLF